VTSVTWPLAGAQIQKKFTFFLRNARQRRRTNRTRAAAAYACICRSALFFRFRQKINALPAWHLPPLRLLGLVADDVKFMNG
jgi:hypothetical protein